MQAKRLPAMQLTIKEQEQIQKWIGHGKMEGAEVLPQLNSMREARGEIPMEKSTVYRSIRGETHKRGAPETRGRPII